MGKTATQRGMNLIFVVLNVHIYFMNTLFFFTQKELDDQVSVWHPTQPSRKGLTFADFS